MKFNVQGTDYLIEFERQRKEVVVRATGEVVQSRHPYTTVNIIKLAQDGGKSLIRTATVGTFSGDSFTHEGGRLNALRAVSRSMLKEKDFKKAMWAAYVNRSRA